MHNINKHLLAVGIAGALAVAPLAASAQNATSSDQSSAQQANQDNQTFLGHTNDAWITTKVKTNLATTDGVDANAINVNTENGQVKLIGRVDNNHARDLAMQAARSVEGVKSVDTSGLTVAMAGAGDQSGNGQATAQNQTALGATNDAWITTKVKSQLATAHDVSATRINVDTSQGHVTLTGTVDDAQAREQARQIAQQTAGVKSVDVTHLMVNGGASATAETGTAGYGNAKRGYDTTGYDNNSTASSGDQQQQGNRTMLGHVDDGWITTKVKSQLATNDQVKASDINVDTSGGRVRLTGTVANAQALDTARQVAQNVKGVRSVDTSGLTITNNQQRTADIDDQQ